MTEQKKTGKSSPLRNNEFAAFSRAFLSFQIDAIDRVAEDVLVKGGTPKDLLDACKQCMEEIGKKFEAGEYYLPELVVAGEMFKKVSARIHLLIHAKDIRPAGALVLGTPKGDIHHLGKDIFKVLAEASGFAVYDLGVDVAPRTFVEKLEETGAPILGMSALITAAFDPMQEVIHLLEEKGVRNRVRIVIGGGVTTKLMAKRLRVDAQTQDAYEGLKMVRSLLLQATVRV
jgi:methanogenic corrinoid protein MtbC1